MTRRREWGALAALVLVSTAFRAWAAVSVPVSWIAGLLGTTVFQLDRGS